MKHRSQLLAVVVMLVIIICIGGCSVDSSTSAKVSQGPAPQSQAATVSPQQLRASFSQALQRWCTSSSDTKAGMRGTYYPVDYDIINSDSALYPYQAVALVDNRFELLDTSTGQWRESGEPMRWRITFRGDGRIWEYVGGRMLH